MQIEHINALLSVTTEVLESMECSGVKAGGVKVISEDFLEAEGSLVFTGITGDLEGILVLLFSCERAAALASSLFQMPVAPDNREEVCECMEELANIIAGHLANALTSYGIGVGITPPAMVSGPPLRLDLPERASTVLVPITATQGDFELLMSVRNAKRRSQERS